MPLDHGCLSSKEYQSPMAQSVARQAVNLQVAGSNPAGGGVCAASAVVQWLGYLAFTQETRVQTPAAERFVSENADGRVRTCACRAHSLSRRAP